jgi:hypothetical protein
MGRLKFFINDVMVLGTLTLDLYLLADRIVG